MIPLPYVNMNNQDKEEPAEENTQTQIIESTSTDEPPSYEVPKPRTAFSSFVDHPQEFLRFLEACLDSNSLQKDDKVDIYTTLFEMYLRMANEKGSTNKTVWENKAKNLITSQGVS